MFLVVKEIRKCLKLENFENIKKQRFHHFKRHLYQNEKADNMQVVAGRLVIKFIQNGTMTENPRFRL